LPKGIHTIIKRVEIFVEEFYSSIYPSFHSVFAKLECSSLNCFGCFSFLLLLCYVFQIIYLDGSLVQIVVYSNKSIRVVLVSYYDICLIVEVTGLR
jgi:hypothetical protein